MLEFAWFFVIGAIAGYLARAFSKSRRFALAGDFVIGILGSMLGGYLLGGLANRDVGRPGAVVLALFGSIIMLSVANLAAKPRPSRSRSGAR